ncbi:DUF1566 domain-containing protein, partial [Candidatus Uhrbacteria bacterium]|nr:DUF1566 domain-containing protein [Candidatus Uhrbacteria bacterium]MBD3284068.1 DUF1566 domain-containing protein [Candidatus Uhrbacteria bacterium]
EYGDESTGSRFIDSQWITSDIYVATVMGGQECFFGVNFADGRIKCYPTQSGGNQGYFLRLVRGGSYGVNQFSNNGNGTVTDASSGLTWQQGDSGSGMDWGDALSYCEQLSLGGATDWRLPNAKELQYIVDYTRSPDTTGSASIDAMFSSTQITNEAGQPDYPFYWTGTTHVKSNGMGDNAAYVSFGRALGYFQNQYMDVHGAGAQRSDPKSGNMSDYPQTHGPQGDVLRLHNYVRCVRGESTVTEGESYTGGTTIDQGGSSEPPSEPMSSQPPSGGEPPVEAQTACSGKSNGASCSFQAPHGTISGSCRSVGSSFACVP